MVYYHVTETRNLNSIMQKGLLPKTGRRSSKIGDFGVFLFKTLQDLEDGMSTWLGDEFDEDVEITILEVDLSDDIEIFDDGLYEICVKVKIPPDSLTIYRDPALTL